MSKTITLLISLSFVVAAACGGPKKKQDDTLIESDQASESCCCRIETENPTDPTFTLVQVMECSSRRGTCLQTSTQCEGQPEPGTEEIDSGALPPVVEESPTSF
jgi:hypothetical protein